jgi:hypothetical protein
VASARVQLGQLLPERLTSGVCDGLLNGVSVALLIGGFFGIGPMGEKLHHLRKLVGIHFRYVHTRVSRETMPSAHHACCSDTITPAERSESE